MTRIFAAIALLLLTACGHPSTEGAYSDAVFAASRRTRTENSKLYAGYVACPADSPSWRPDPNLHLLTGPGFERCPAIVAEYRAAYERNVALERARIDADAERARAEEHALLLRNVREAP